MKPAQKPCWWQNSFHSDWKIIDYRNCSEVKIARTPMSESPRDWDEKSVEVLARGWFWCNWDVADSLFSSNTHSSRSSPTNWASNKAVVTFLHRRILVQIWTSIQMWLEPCKKPVCLHLWTLGISGNDVLGVSRNKVSFMTTMVQNLTFKW